MWISNDLTTKLTYSSLLETTLYNSNYSMIISFIDKKHLFNECSLAKAKQRNISRKIFNYEKMTSEKWNNFKNATKTQLEKNPLIIIEERVSSRLMKSTNYGVIFGTV